MYTKHEEVLTRVHLQRQTIVSSHKISMKVINETFYIKSIYSQHLFQETPVSLSFYKASFVFQIKSFVTRIWLNQKFTKRF